jgi:hypothetical protein
MMFRNLYIDEIQTHMQEAEQKPYHVGQAGNSGLQAQTRFIFIVFDKKTIAYYSWNNKLAYMINPFTPLKGDKVTGD